MSAELARPSVEADASGAAPFARFTAQLDLTIRLCRADDLPRLEWFGAFTHHRDIIGEAFALQDRGEAVMLVADLGGFPVGQAWLDLRPRPGAHGPMVWAVRVLEPLRGLGLGRRLMMALERLGVELGHQRLELGVERENDAARRFYERLGWRLAGERRECYDYVTPAGEAVSHDLDELVLIKDLR